MRIEHTTNNPNIHFQSRCVEIRDCEWVIRTFYRELPHFSQTKFKPLVVKYYNREKALLDAKKPPKFSLKALMKADFYSKILHPKDFFKNFKIKPLIEKYLKLPQTKAEENKFYEKIVNLNMLLKRIDGKRLLLYHGEGNENIYTILHIIKDYKLGNCFEEAKVMELIMRLNGIKNICTALPYSGANELDHLVCVFNRDGTKFDGKITNSTIIIDPWIQKADFAHNIFKYYKNVIAQNMCAVDSLTGSRIPFNPNDKITLKPHEELKLTYADIEALKIEFPNLIFRNKKREFMYR
ncbi:hypothetical protein IJ596_06700 [bacterium]|nr:hypothetical protein [bacterium]